MANRAYGETEQGGDATQGPATPKAKTIPVHFRIPLADYQGMAELVLNSKAKITISAVARQAIKSHVKKFRK